MAVKVYLMTMKETSPELLKIFTHSDTLNIFRI